MKKLSSLLPGLAISLFFPVLVLSQDGMHSVATLDLVQQIEAENAPLILDVRTEEEFSAGHIPGAINIPHEQLAENIDRIREYTNQPLVLHCRSGRRAELAAVVLEDNGFTNVLMLDGHFLQWQADGLPIESP